MGKLSTKYTSEFKQTIVNLYHSGKSYGQIQKEYGVSHSALANWIKQYSEVQIDNDTIMTAKQINDLQKRNALLGGNHFKGHGHFFLFRPHKVTLFGNALGKQLHHFNIVRADHTIEILSQQIVPFVIGAEIFKVKFVFVVHTKHNLFISDSTLFCIQSTARILATVMSGISTISSSVTVRIRAGEYPVCEKMRNKRCSNFSLLILVGSFRCSYFGGGSTSKIMVYFNIKSRPPTKVGNWLCIKGYLCYSEMAIWI